MEPPGQTTLSQFELAILSRIAAAVPPLLDLIPKLNVLSREFTGVGSFTRFRCQEPVPELGDKPITLQSIINVPSVEHGMGAVLFCKDGKPNTLETCTFGDEEWEGDYDGFSIARTE